jgi:hypothetical protein
MNNIYVCVMIIIYYYAVGVYDNPNDEQVLTLKSVEHVRQRVELNS